MGRQAAGRARCSPASSTAATIASVPAGRLSDRLGTRGPLIVMAAGVGAFALSCGLFTVAAAITFLAIPFVLVGVGIGAVETVQHSAVADLAPKDLRGSAFAMLATVQVPGLDHPSHPLALGPFEQRPDRGERPVGLQSLDHQAGPHHRPDRGESLGAG
ncbi:MFS transporter [Streptomyces sp. ISL-44]|uniref:MFS transporter n=1 Tax=Streptomyces sp. ISL-44 TaxID=2819184 RepID=UPI0027E37D17|nr:MFS transporter [Streptomyces sp. ISL-44]